MRWWNEGAASISMYHAVLACYEDLAGWYGGQVSDDELIYSWVEQPPDVALIDAGKVKDRLRAEHLDDVIATAIPGL